MSGRTGIIALIVGATVTTAPLVLGQSAAIDGEIIGTVMDPSGAGVAGAVVQIVNVATGFKQATRAAQSGLYRFSLLPVGTYDLTTQAVGDRKSTRLNSSH